jgi:hypothetical protein
VGVVVGIGAMEGHGHGAGESGRELEWHRDQRAGVGPVQRLPDGQLSVFGFLAV